MGRRGKGRLEGTESNPDESRRGNGNLMSARCQGAKRIGRRSRKAREGGMPHLSEAYLNITRERADD